jgi:hypothetical protein
MVVTAVLELQVPLLGKPNPTYAGGGGGGGTLYWWCWRRVVVVAMAVRVRSMVVLDSSYGWRWRWCWTNVTLFRGGTGGSGVVVLRVPNTAAAVFSGGVATRSYDVVGYTTYEVQATTTTGETVTFYPNAFLAEYLVVAGGGGGGGDVQYQVQVAAGLVVISLCFMPLQWQLLLVRLIQSLLVVAVLVRSSRSAGSAMDQILNLPLLFPLVAVVDGVHHLLSGINGGSGGGFWNNFRPGLLVLVTLRSEAHHKEIMEANPV